MDISTIFIHSFRNFSDFKMTFPERERDEDEKINLNILVGRNGSGKSNLLDALYKIGEHKDLKDCGFDFYIQDRNNDLLLATIDPVSKKTKIFPQSSKENDSLYWDKVIRFHCSNKTRNQESFYGDGQIVIEKFFIDNLEDENNENIEEDICIKDFSNRCFDFNIKRSKFAFIAYILSGQYFKDEEQGSDNLWKKLNAIVIEENPDDPKNELVPEIIWVDVHNGNVFLDEIKPKFNFSKPSLIDLKDGEAYYWKMDDLREFYKYNDAKDPKKLLEKYFSSYYCYDAGFLYRIQECNTEQKKDLASYTTLSDGQVAFLYRFAIVNLLKNEDKKCLLLLDEPETYFNEYWKSYFVYLVHKTLKDKPHDIFISTHSAMLITDSKIEEVHRLVNNSQGAYHCRPELNTYGVNVVDIGKYLFMMESDIGNRSKEEIETVIKLPENTSTDIEVKEIKLKNLLQKVGPGEWRWKLRASLNSLDAARKRFKCTNFELKED